MPPLSGVSPLAVSLPKGGGDLRGLGGNFVTDYNRGTGSYAVDLQLPTGPAGLRPALGLGYNSGSANGAFGLGWSLGVPSIHRDGERRFVRYDETDTFRLDLHGELVRLADGSYRPKHDELFARIEHGDHWELFPKDGGIQRFGVDTHARIVDPDHPDRVLAWALQEAEDRHGNRITYRYLADRNNRYLQEIAYGPYRVELTYEPRTDVFGTARHGFPIDTALRCSAIDIHCDRLPGPSLIRRYELTYIEPDETPISLLHQIQLSGHRGADVEEMPPLTFSYTAYQPPKSRCRTLTSELGYPLAPLGMPGVDLLDCTGDGLPDLVQIDDAQHRFWANRGDGTFAPPRTIGSLPAGVRLDSPGVTFGDMDGDGAADILVAEGPHTGYFPKTGPATWGPFQRFRRAPTYSLRDPNNRLVDLDADGRIDLLRTTPTAFVLHLNRGDDWEALPPIPRVRDPELFPDVSLADPRVHLADMTGDGLPDIVLVRSGEVAYWPYQGLGKWGHQQVMPGSPAFARPTQPRHVFLTDVNGDGIADLVVVEGDTVTVWINQFGAAFAKPIPLRHTPSPAGAKIYLADMLGTGTAGVVWSYRESIRPGTGYFHLDLAGEQKPYLLQSIDNGLGKQTQIRYTSSSRFAAHDRAHGRPWTTFLPFPVHVVAEIRQDDPLAGLATRLEIDYHDGLYDGRERRFAGFGHVDLIEHGDTTAPGLLTTMHFDTTPTTGLGHDERELAVARWGKLLDTRQQAVDGPLLRTSSNEWTATVADHGEDGTPIVTVHRTATRSVAPGTADTEVVTEHAYRFDECGNVVSDHSTANGDTPLALTTQVEYAHRPDGSLTGLPSRVTDRRDDSTVVREVRCYYDGPAFVGLPLGQTTVGRAVRQSVRVLDEADFTAHYGAQGFTAAALGFRTEDGAVWSDVSRYHYDTLGNLTTSRDPLGNDTTLLHDPDGVFPTRLTNPAGHLTRFDWDDAALQPDQVVDPNGAITRFRFDALGRVVRLALPGDTLADPSETVTYHLTESSLPANSPPFVDLQQKRGVGAPPARRRTYYEGSGETHQIRTTIDDAAVLVSPFVVRNHRGWVSRAGDPTFATSLDFAPAPEVAPATLQYDALGRTVATHLPGGRNTRVVYDAFRTISYDANDTDDSPENIARGFFDTPTTHHLDGWGRLIGISEQHDGTTTDHNYRHGELGRLVEVTGPDGGRILNQRFDLAGNRLELDHRDAGRRQFYCDAAGRPVRTVDAAGTRVDTAYDKLGRPTTTSIDGVAVHNFVYDATNLPHRVGRLSTAHDEAGEWAFEYDERGRPTRRTLTAFGRSWTLEHRYHSNGQIASILYPDNTTITYRYNRACQLIGVPGALEDVHFDARGRCTSLSAANGVTTRIDYDPLTHFLTRHRITGPGNTMLHDTTYQRDKVGNLLAQVDGRPPGPAAPHSRSFTLDGRYRLLEAAGGGSPAVPAYTRTYAYDAADNIRTYPTHGAAPITYDPPGSNRIGGIIVGGATQSLYTHDANGNLTHLPGRDLTYDGLGRLVKVQRADGAQVTYRYNAAGERIWRTTEIGGTTRRTLFLAGLYEEDDDGSIRRYLTTGSTPIAVDQSGGRTYLHGNELGHIVAVTEPAGALTGTRLFHPYGETNHPPGTPTLPSFGGKLLDDISGLYHFGARYYAPEIGRFTSPDALYLSAPTLATTNPQLFNLYAYAANNPIVYADPSGLSLLGSVLGGLFGGLVGALTFVLSGCNPAIAGLAGGLVGGAVAGGIDGGSKGAVIGGLFGALTGAVGGAVMWGLSTASWHIGGYLLQDWTNTLVGVGAFAATFYGGIWQGGMHGNWDMTAATAAGLVGASLGTALGNNIKMAGFWNSGPDTLRAVKETHRVYAERAPRIDDTKYVLDQTTTRNAVAHENHGTVTFNWRSPNRLDDYAEYLQTHAHELGHALQEKNYHGPYKSFDDDWSASVKKYGTGMENPWQRDAENTGRWLQNFVPVVGGSFSRFGQPCPIYLVPAALSASLPTAYDKSDRGDDLWRDLD